MFWVGSGYSRRRRKEKGVARKALCTCGISGVFEEEEGERFDKSAQPTSNLLVGNIRSNVRDPTLRPFVALQ